MEAKLRRPAAGRERDARDHGAVAVSGHKELAADGKAPCGVDDEAVALVWLRLHRVAACPDDAKRHGAGFSFVAGHAYRELLPSALLEHELLAPGARVRDDLLRMKIGDFLRDTRAGATALVAAATAVITVGATALIVDHAWLVGQRDMLKAASDAGAVAATLEMNRQLAENPQISDEALEAALKTVARRYIILNFQHLSEDRFGRAVESLVVKALPDRALGTVAVNAEADLGGTLLSRRMPLLGNYPGPPTTRTASKTERTKVPVEIVLGIDVSLSMAWALDGTPRVPEHESRMHVVKQASLALVDALDPEAEHLIAVGLVPWHVLVHLDDDAVDRWILNDWAQYPSTRRYAEPYRYYRSRGRPPAVVDTLAPDPPEPWHGCLDEHRITTASKDAAWPAIGELMNPPSTMAFAQGIFPALKRHSYACLPEPLPGNFQMQFCYTDRQVSEANASRQRLRGAQYTCHPSGPTMFPLTSDRPRIEQAIDGLWPVGQGTYSTLGVLWAHRMLSHSWKRVWGDAVHPLDRAGDNQDVRKAIVLLTDGEDNYCGDAAGACMSSEVGIDRGEACALAKNAGIEIFVVAAMAPDKVTGEFAQSLRSCSSQSEYPDGQYVFINNDDEDDLRNAFVDIANQMQEIRKLY